MSAPKVHLAVGARVACKTTAWRRRSVIPADVTCVGCQRTPHMADAEIRHRLRQSH